MISTARFIDIDLARRKFKQEKRKKRHSTRQKTHDIRHFCRNPICTSTGRPASYRNQNDATKYATNTTTTNLSRKPKSVSYHVGNNMSTRSLARKPFLQDFLSSTRGKFAQRRLWWSSSTNNARYGSCDYTCTHTDIHRSFVSNLA
jgi:Cu2+-containing amine oxidase